MKTIRSGSVAVLISPGYGAGWSTWNNDKFRDLLLFDSRLIELVEKEDFSTLQDADKVKALLGIETEEHLCCLGGDSLKIKWVEEGTLFYIQEYDGNESIHYGSSEFITA